MLPGLPEPLVWFVNHDGSSLELVVSKLGDVNGDGVVNVVDLLELLGLWGPCPAPCAADLNGDGDVGVVVMVN